MEPPQKQDGRPPGSKRVCFVTAVLLLAALSGGACLVLYVTLPPDSVPQWLAAAGLALVALPWTFWIATCLYRCCCSSSAAAPIVERQGSRPAAVAPSASMKSARAGNASWRHDQSPAGSPGGARRVHFGDPTMLATECSGDNTEDDGAGGSSVNSHESEVPLAHSMSS